MGLNNMVSKVEQAVRLRHLGIGFVWAWIYCSFSTSALFANRGGSSINADSSWLASAVAVSACLFAFALAGRRVDVTRFRPAAFMGAALMAAGTFCSGAFALPLWASAACGVASGIGSALLVAFWGDALARIEAERVEIAIPAASGVMLACVFVFPYIQGLPGVFGVSSLPVFSMLCLFLTWADIDSGIYGVSRGSDCGGEERRPRANAVRPARLASSAMAARRSDATVFLARISFVLFAAYLAIGAMSAMEGASDAFQELYGFDIGTFIGSACGVAMAFWFIFFSPHVNVVALLRWVFPILVIGLSAMPFSGLMAGFVASTASSVADTVLQSIAILSLVNLARNGVFSPVFAVCAGQGAIQLGVLAGNLLGNWFAGAIFAGDIEMWMVPLVVICLLSVAMAALPSNGREAAYWRLSGIDDCDEAFGHVGYAATQDGTVSCSEEKGAYRSGSGGRAQGMAALGGVEPVSIRGARRAAEPDDEWDASFAGAGPDDSCVSGGGHACSPHAGGANAVNSLDAKVVRIAADGGLSARETEVLGYLARGRSQPYIRDTLVLSKNTVASHVKHIYQKLDVHSRQELLDLFAE